MAVIPITPPILWTLNRCQEIGNPLAFITTGDHNYLVPCYEMNEYRLVPINFFTKTSLSARNIVEIPPNILTDRYPSSLTPNSYSGVELLVYATYTYPGIDPLYPHLQTRVVVDEYGTIVRDEHGKPKYAYDCAQCAHRIDCLDILKNVFISLAQQSQNSFYNTLTDIINICSLESTCIPTTPTPSQPPTPSPRPPSRTPSRLEISPLPNGIPPEFPVQFADRI